MRENEIAQNEELKLEKSLEKSQNVLEQTRKFGQAEILHKKTNSFTLIASNFAREQLKTVSVNRCLRN